MSSRTPIHLLLALFFQLFLQPSPVHSATIPQSFGIATKDAAVNADRAQCIDNEGWVGEGIIVSDCAEAIREFYRTQVQPRREQHYEFLHRGVTRTTALPYINTPRKFDYGEQRIYVTCSTFIPLTRITTGTCVIDIGMLDTYWPGSPAEIRPLYTRTDIATFNEIMNAAKYLYSKCVNAKQEPVAGWTFTGMLAQCSRQDCVYAALNCV